MVLVGYPGLGDVPLDPSLVKKMALAPLEAVRLRAWPLCVSDKRI